jgi:two-component system, OmpR family, phosphate regulon sensor histidine kinase PhoR
MFYRAPNKYAQTVPGMGIGLSLVKSIVELHDGHIGIESTVGAGATFTLELPGVLGAANDELLSVSSA